MIEGFREIIRREIGDITVVKRRRMEEHTAAMLTTRRRAFRSSHFLHIRKGDAKLWTKNPDIQATVLHELGHTVFNGIAIPAIRGSHFLQELGATVYGYLRFGHIAPEVKRRHIVKKIFLSWPYYTEEIGLGMNELTTLLISAYVPARITDLYLSGFRSISVYALIASLYVWVVSSGMDSVRVTKRRGLKSFRLNGIW